MTPLLPDIAPEAYPSIDSQSSYKSESTECASSRPNPLKRPRNAGSSSPTACKAFRHPQHRSQSPTKVTRLQDSALKFKRLQSQVALDPVRIAPASDAQRARPMSDNHTEFTGMDGLIHVANNPALMDANSQLDNRPHTPHLLRAPSQVDARNFREASESMSFGASPDVTAPTRVPSTASGMPMTANTTRAPAPSVEVELRSPSSGKKHKCPYCDTDFTRQHNLKSHLLTHSQEKPYECESCSARFRRLHDLKRHTKLHTGEKPHVCPKCDRKFARGDALARHTKGQGGCAGRRHSEPFDRELSSFEGHTAGDERALNKYQLSNQDRAEAGQRHYRCTIDSLAPTSSTHARTYPPTGVRSGATYSLPGPSTITRPSNSSSNDLPHPFPFASTLFASNTMTESPRPLSPPRGSMGQSQQVCHCLLGARPRIRRSEFADGLTRQYSHQHHHQSQIGPSSYFPEPSVRSTVSGPGPAASRPAREDTVDVAQPADKSSSYMACSLENTHSGQSTTLAEIQARMLSLNGIVKQLENRLQEKDAQISENNIMISRLSSRVADLEDQVNALRDPGEAKASRNS